MPSLTQPFPKKRRRDEEDAVTQDIHLSLYVDEKSPASPPASADNSALSPQDLHGYYPHQQHHGASPRKIIPYPSPLAKKIRMSSERSSEEPQKQAPLTPSSRHNKNQTRSPATAPAAAAATIKQHSPSKTAAPTNLSPCHICHRKPTKKTELDSYADCEGCGERTCYVCIRECLGWKGTPTSATTHDVIHDNHDDEILMKDDHDYGQDENRKADEDNEDADGGQGDLDQSFSMEDAPWTQEANPSQGQDRTKRGGTWGKGGGRGHRGRICSQCCVEDGPEGEVICLGCLGT